MKALIDHYKMLSNISIAKKFIINKLLFVTTCFTYTDYFGQ